MEWLCAELIVGGPSLTISPSARTLAAACWPASGPDGADPGSDTPRGAVRWAKVASADSLAGDLVKNWDVSPTCPVTVAPAWRSALVTPVTVPPSAFGAVTTMTR